jgi:hypothetical protein
VRELTKEETEYVRSLPIRQLKAVLQDQKVLTNGLTTLFMELCDGSQMTRYASTMN